MAGRAAKIALRNINNLRYTDDTTLMAESEEELRSLLKVMTRVRQPENLFALKVLFLLKSGATLRKH